jgi:hypothetical protein
MEVNLGQSKQETNRIQSVEMRYLKAALDQAKLRRKIL